MDKSLLYGQERPNTVLQKSYWASISHVSPSKVSIQHPLGQPSYRGAGSPKIFHTAVQCMDLTLFILRTPSECNGGVLSTKWSQWVKTPLSTFKLAFHTIQRCCTTFLLSYQTLRSNNIFGLYSLNDFKREPSLRNLLTLK